MRKQIISFLYLTILASVTTCKIINAQTQLYSIPSQTLNPYKIIGDDSWTGTKMHINGFQISEFITYGEYKEFIKSIKEDTSVIFYRSPLPDSKIGSAEVYNKYITSPEYDTFPVLGISYKNAMRFCKWKTIKDNPKDSITFIYRLPLCLEWVAAYNYLQENKIQNDFNKNYSDWLLDLKYNMEPFNFNKINTDYTLRFIQPEYKYDPNPGDLEMLDKQFVIGNSYLFQHDKLLNCYSYIYYQKEGYKHISFRYVKEYLNEGRVIDDINLPKAILGTWLFKRK